MQSAAEAAVDPEPVANGCLGYKLEESQTQVLARCRPRAVRRRTDDARPSLLDHGRTHPEDPYRYRPRLGQDPPPQGALTPSYKKSVRRLLDGGWAAAMVSPATRNRAPGGPPCRTKLPSPSIDAEHRRRRTRSSVFDHRQGRRPVTTIVRWPAGSTQSPSWLNPGPVPRDAGRRTPAGPSQPPRRSSTFDLPELGADVLRQTDGFAFSTPLPPDVPNLPFGSPSSRWRRPKHVACASSCNQC